MPLPSFALLDDNSPGQDAGGTAPSPRSRLYTGYHSSLVATDANALPALLENLQSALQQDLHAVALFSYELGAQLQQIVPSSISTSSNGQPPVPAAQILLFNQCRLLSTAETDAWLQQQDDAAVDAAGIANVRANIDAARFSADIARIHAYIAAGDTYQVNYTYRLHFDAYGAPLRLYRQLRARQPVPYGALISLPDQRCILSFSPELFVRHQQGLLHTQPMKGTAPAALEAGSDAENQRRAEHLAQDEKNRAENLMIVDLLRNDLGRVAVNGSVRVPHLFQVTRFGQVLQMTSTITAQLRSDVGLSQVVTALYPCGSITGAPKRRTMQIINELESAPRGLYTGAIGWFERAAAGHQVGDFCLSVPIRTLLLQAPRNGARAGEMGVGAGIVHDSRASDEYAECRLKAGFLTGLAADFSLFETLHASREEGCRHLELHLARLRQSAAYFNFAYHEQTVRTALEQACLQLPAATPHRLRLDLQRDGSVGLQQGILSALPARIKAFIAPQLSHSDDLFLRHKSSRRLVYDQAWKAAEQRGGFDMLFFNQRGELTEGGRSNVFVKLAGRWYTPPLAAGALAGVMRAVLLQDPAWAATERTLTRADLDMAQQVVLCNALRGVMLADIDNAF